jgi:flavodoxin
MIWPMKTAVAYYSKTGNTKAIADAIAKAVGCDSIAINLMKRGRKTKQEMAEEKRLFKDGIDQCRQSDLVFIGTPTEFRKPHPKIVEFISCLNIKKAAIFCTYYGMLGATFYDLEALLLQKNIALINELNLVVGTEKYKFSRDISQYQEKITREHLQKAVDFALLTTAKKRALPLRLQGVCGKDCQGCARFNKTCQGAGHRCWSGSRCKIFNCAVIKNSFLSCVDCTKSARCTLIKNNKL